MLGTAGTAPNNLIFDSTLNTFKILKTGTVAVTHGTSAGTTSVAHDQSTIPTAYAFFKFASGYTGLPNERDRGTLGSSNFNSWQVEMDDTNLYFVFPNSVTSYSGTIRYYVFEAPGA